MQRHGHRTKSKRGVQFNKNHDDWCTYLNFKEMYNKSYDLLVEKGIATKFDQKASFDKSGNIVESEEDLGAKILKLPPLPRKVPVH